MIKNLENALYIQKKFRIYEKWLSGKRLEENYIGFFNEKWSLVVRETYRRLSIPTVTNNGKYPLYLVHV